MGTILLLSFPVFFRLNFISASDSSHIFHDFITIFSYYKQVSCYWKNILKITRQQLTANQYWRNNYPDYERHYHTESR